MQKAIVISIFLILNFTASFAQNKQDKKLTESLDKLISERLANVAPGCAVLVAKKGQVMYEKGFGIVNIELAVPMQPDMIFRIGSMTKQYTAIAILQLIEQGKISLQDSIQKFIKNFGTLLFYRRVHL